MVSALPRGAAVILRDYESKDRAAQAAQLHSICAARGVFLLIGADPALAEEIGADGVHFPAWFKGPLRAPPGAIKTISCHSAAEIRRLAKNEIDAVLLSPAFPTASHPDATALGAVKFRQLAASSPAPVLALGGVDEANASQLAGANVAGIAAIGAFLS